MRRALLAVLLAAACGAPAPEPAAVPPASATAASWLEIEAAGKGVVLARVDETGKKLFEIPYDDIGPTIPAPDGGAFVARKRELSRLGPKGERVWKADLVDGGDRLAAIGDRVLLFDGSRIRVHDASMGTLLRAVALAEPPTDVAERDGVVILADAKRVSRIGPEGEPIWSVPLRLFPSPDAMTERFIRRVACVSTDGTVLTGATDGSLVALDPAGKPLWQVGVRGAVERIEARPGGAFAIFGARGFVALAEAGGKLRSGPEATLPKGFLPVLDRRRAAALPSWKPTAAYRAERQVLRGKPIRSATSVVALGPRDVWALVGLESPPGETDPPIHLVHFDGARWLDHGVPRFDFPKEVFATGHPAAEGAFLVSRLARSPTGTALLLGARVADAARPAALEISGTGFRERRDLAAPFAGVPFMRRWPVALSLSYAASAGGREVLCAEAPDREHPLSCLELRPGSAPRLFSAESEGKKLPGGPTEPPGSREGHAAPVLFAGETIWTTNGFARAESDVIGIASHGLTRWDGATAREILAPFGGIRSLWAPAGSADDLWVAGGAGLSRFDGHAWQRILEVDGDPANPSDLDLAVTGAGPGDVWAFGPRGLWHVTAAPAAEPDLVGAPAPLPPPAAASIPLAVSGVERAYRLEQVTLAIPGGPPMRSALSVAAGPGGIVWLFDGVRLVEHDGATARVLHEAPRPQPFVCWSAPEPDCGVCAACTPRRPKAIECQRCVAPTGPGEGVLLDEGGWRRVSGGKLAGNARALPALLGVAATPEGAVWGVSSQDDDALPHAVIGTPRGLRLIDGLPAAAWADVAARAGDDVWFAGGLATPTTALRAWPEGEGVLAHFDGRAFTLHRGAEGALLAVAAVGPGEAWAVGVGGGILRAKGGSVEALRLATVDGRTDGVILRTVAASHTGEVWIGGDRGTLLRWDGQALRRVEGPAPVGVITAIVAPADGPGWAAGPGGIYRLVPAR